MAYDKKLKDEIDAMGAGDLVHHMVANFEKQPQVGSDENYPALQSRGYFWAYVRLNELLPGKEPSDDI